MTYYFPYVNDNILIRLVKRLLHLTDHCKYIALDFDSGNPFTSPAFICCSNRKHYGCTYLVFDFIVLNIFHTTVFIKSLFIKWTCLSGSPKSKFWHQEDCITTPFCLTDEMPCNTRKGTFGRLRKVSFQISLRSPHRLI